MADPRGGSERRKGRKLEETQEKAKTIAAITASVLSC